MLIKNKIRWKKNERFLLYVPGSSPYQLNAGFVVAADSFSFLFSFFLNPYSFNDLMSWSKYEYFYSSKHSIGSFFFFWDHCKARRRGSSVIVFRRTPRTSVLMYTQHADKSLSHDQNVLKKRYSEVMIETMLQRQNLHIFFFFIKVKS
jgi:hypothetical protein